MDNGNNNQQPMNNMNQINTNNKAKSGMNQNAIISCIFSVVAIFIFGWLAYVGLGLGISAVAEIKKKKEKGMVFAIIGIIIGFVGTVLNIYGMMMR